MTLAATGCLLENPAWLGPAGDGSGDGGGTSGEELPVGCDDVLPMPGDAIQVAHADADMLDDIVASAPVDATLVLEDGVYDRAGKPPLRIASAGVTLRGSSVDAKVVLDGGFAVDLLVEIVADDVTLADLELRNANVDLVAVHAADTPVLRPRMLRLSLGDSSSAQILAEPSTTPAVAFVDDGEVACSRFTVSDELRMLDPCLLGGLRVTGGRDWHVHDNRFTGHWCPTTTASTAVRFSDGARDTLIERNVFVENQRAIGFGGDGTAEARAYADNPCTPGVFWGHIGGTIRNNTIWIGEPAAGFGADAMIYAWWTCDAAIQHNTIVNLVDVFNSIEYRYDRTTVTIANNLATHVILQRESANAQIVGNLEMADLALVVDPLVGDVHLRSDAALAIDQALPLSQNPVTDDFEGDARDATPDIGADELVAQSR
ncbi:MAG TPA: hypothetical protein VFG69_07445 [Nannocystaceae bacterium]|nr:hypothetical protein [Nannocystaceae bacterium]